MSNLRHMTGQLLRLMAGVLIVKVTIGVLLKYGDYLPPNFRSDFLWGREPYFFGSYAWAFYLHISTGPISLLLGLVLLNVQFRQRGPKWHRIAGRVQVFVVLFGVAPSGLWIAYHAMSGAIAAMGFAALAILTGATVALGWRSAVARRFQEHRQWMMRCYLLLCAAVVIRLIGGLATVMGSQAMWIYPTAAWVSWLVPLAVFEARRAWTLGLLRKHVPNLSPKRKRGFCWRT